MIELLEFVVRGLLIGVTYGLLAYPISLLFVATDTVDLAIGGYAVLAAAVAVLFPGWEGFAAGLVAAMLAASVVGAVSAVLNRKLNGDPLTIVLASFGFAIVLESVVLTVFGKDPFIRQPFSTFWNVLGMRISPQAGINVAVGIAILAAVYGLLYRTRWGQTMRASAINPRGATLAGIHVRLVQFSAFLIAGALAGIAGLLILYTSGMDFASGLPLTLASFGAAIVFGLHNPLYGFFGGIAIGVVEALSVGLAPSGLGSLIPLVFVFAVLCMGKFSKASIAGGRA